MTGEKIAAARNLLEDGRPATEVATVLGISVATLYRHCPARRDVPETS